MAKTKETRQAYVIKVLENLAHQEPGNKILKNALYYSIENGNLTPKYAAIVFSKLKKHKIDYQPSFFRINLKRDKYQNSMRNLNGYQIELILPTLTKSQREIAQRLKIKAPLSLIKDS